MSTENIITSVEELAKKNPEQAKPVEVKKEKLTEIEKMELEIKRMELETKKLEYEEKKANLQDLRERLDERELRRENKRQRSITNGETLKQNAHNDSVAQKRCNHKKGGNGAAGIVGGQGDDSQYAVIKHQMCNGDMWVRCLRCGKTWKPPIKSDHTFNSKGVVDPKGTFDQDSFNRTERDYVEAKAFQTRNTASGSVQFRFSDGGEHFRQVATKDVNLR